MLPAQHDTSDNNPRILPVYMVAKWENGSFLRVPALWYPEGAVQVDRVKWNAVQHPIITRVTAPLAEINIHFRMESLELPVSHKTEEGIEYFWADRNAMPVFTPAVQLPPLHKTTLPYEVTTNLVEDMMVASLGALTIALQSGPSKTGPKWAALAANFHKQFNDLNEGFPIAVPTKLRNGAKSILPLTTIDILRSSTKDIANRLVLPRSACPEYAAYLALEDCQRRLRSALGNYADQYAQCYTALMEKDPSLQDNYPLFVETADETIPAWLFSISRQSVAEGMKIINPAPGQETAYLLSPIVENLIPAAASKIAAEPRRPAVG